MIGEFLDPLYKFFRSVQVVNLDSPVINEEEFKHVMVSNADGCALPYPDQSFDWIFSNAVIEHVGGAARQKLFAAEIQRVARKGYFVATPNRHFPVDPHTLLPFYQFLSPRLQSEGVPFRTRLRARLRTRFICFPRTICEIYFQAPPSEKSGMFALSLIT